MMGTFSKNFGASGGYIAGSKQLINYLRVYSHSKCYSSTISPPVAYQIISSMDCIMSDQFRGVQRIEQLSRNAKYFRARLKQMGFILYGNKDSPVVPIRLFMPSKIQAFVVHCLNRDVARVGVGFPITHISEGRVRFCISSSHTKEMLDEALEVIEDIGRYINYNFGQQSCSHIKIIY